MNIQSLHNIYAGKRVFLTGHTGFKGSWLLCWLNFLGAEVKGYALQPLHQNDLYIGINGDELCESVIADIKDKEKLCNEIVNFQPDFIFHLAAQPLVRLSYEIPVETFEVNVIGTANVLDAVKKLNKPCAVVVVTTDKVYENKEWLYPYRENDALGGYDPYSASKAAAEIVVSSYRSSFFNPGAYDKHYKSISSARAGNVIGGGDWSKDRIIPDIVKALSKKEAIFVRNPNSIRPWQHVLEPLAGYLLLGAKMAADPICYAEAFNFGPQSSDVIRVEELVNIAINLWGEGSYNVADDNLASQLHETETLKLDISKALQKLQWRPKLTSEEAIAWTIEWYKRVTPASYKDIILRQISDYSQLK